VHAGKVELRVLGTSVTLQEHIRKRAEQDLGIRLRYIVDDGSAVQRAGVMHPDRYDVYDQWFHSIDCLWPAQALQPIELSRIGRWDEVNSLAKTGRFADLHAAGAGSRPVDRLYVQPDQYAAPDPQRRQLRLPAGRSAPHTGEPA
jgi:putative spermidine/putrescine transport system substrate-binding protein